MSFYDALQLLQGQGIPTTTINQSIFASFAMLLGSVVLAIVFGHVAVLVSNFNANSTNYQRKMEAVFAITSKMQLPEPLRERIHQYYDHLWREYESLDGEIERFSKSLSHTLELEVVLCKYMDLVMGIPFWSDCTPDFQKQLMLNLHVRVYMPEDYVIRRGEVDEEFYMISRGSAELSTGFDSFERPIGGFERQGDGESGDTQSRRWSREIGVGVKVTASGDYHRARVRDSSGLAYKVAKNDADKSDSSLKQNPSLTKRNSDNTVRLRVLTNGHAFGELALLMNYQRTASVRAITYVEMCVLNRSDFQHVMTKHPSDRKKVVAAMLSSCMVKNEVEDVYCPLKEMVRSVYSERGPLRGAQIGAAEAASLIVDMINPNLEDKSIRFGVNSGLKQQLLAKRDANTKTPGVAAVSSATEDVPARDLPAAAAVAESNRVDGSPVPSVLASRIEHIEQSLGNFTKTLSEMRLAIGSISDSFAACAECNCGTARPMITSPRQNRRLSMTRSSTSATVREYGSDLHESRQTESHADVESQLQQSASRVLRVTDRAGAGIASAYTQPLAAAHSPAVTKRHQSLRTRMSTFAELSPSSRAAANTPSPTQYADQLFSTKPRVVFKRHSTESVSSLYRGNSSTTNK